MKRGRPTKLEPNTIAVIVHELAWGASRAAAAQAAGLDERTLRLWRRKGRESQSGPYRELLEKLDGAEARAKAGDPIPVEIVEATVRVVDEDGKKGRREVALDIANLTSLLQRTRLTGWGSGYNRAGQAIWVRMQMSDGHWLSPREDGWIAAGLRVAVVDQFGEHGEIEFTLPDWDNFRRPPLE